MKTILCAAMVCLMTNSGWAEDFVIAPSDLLKVLPAGLQLSKGAPNLQPAIVLANEVLVKKAFGREVQMNLKFTTLEHQAQGLYGKCIAAQAEHTTFGPLAGAQ